MTFSPDLVFDIGAHRGEDSEYYLKKGYRVVAVEAEPLHVEFLSRRFADAIAASRLILVDRAIAAHSGRCAFFRNHTVSVYGTANPAWAERNVEVGTKVEKIEIDCVSPAELFLRYGIPFYLKIDIEGSDLLVLNALQGFAARPPYLSLESDSPRLEDILEQFATMTDLGYDRFKLVPQHLVQLQSVPAQSAHGSSCLHEFEPGSSGMFGEDTEGRWLSASEAVANYKGIVILEQVGVAIRKGILEGSFERFLDAFGHVPSWYDTHARHESA